MLTKYKQRRVILNLVKNLLKSGWSQILIRDGNVYASGGNTPITDEALENAPIVMAKH